MSRYNMSEQSPPHHCRRSWGYWWGERLVSASSGHFFCWASYLIPEVFLFQLRSFKICTPRNLMFSTLSTVRPLILRGACSLVLSALSTRLFSLHQPSTLYHFYEWVPPLWCYLRTWWSCSPCVWMHTCVSSANNNGLSTQPWGDLVLSLIQFEVLFLTGTDWGFSVNSPGSRDMWRCSPDKQTDMGHVMQGGWLWCVNT